MIKYYYFVLICLFLQWTKPAYAQQYNDLQQQFEAVCDMAKAGKISGDEWGKRMEALAEKGHEMSQCCAGVYYERKENYKKALYWYEKAEKQGCGEAIFTIGEFYMDGKGVEKDEKKGFEYWVKAAKYGYDIAMVWVGNCYWFGFVVDIDYYKAFDYYKMAAELGNCDGQFHVGECYQKGFGVIKDLNEAKKWFQLAAKQGEERAIEELKKMEQ